MPGAFIRSFTVQTSAEWRRTAEMVKDSAQLKFILKNSSRNEGYKRYTRVKIQNEYIFLLIYLH